MPETHAQDELKPEAVKAARDAAVTMYLLATERGDTRPLMAATDAAILAYRAALQADPEYLSGQEAVKAAQAALEHDRTKVIEGVNALTDEMTRSSWLMGPGRGSYEWDDERYQAEFSAAIERMRAAIEPLRKIGADWSNCPTDQAAIDAARATPDLKAGKAAVTEAMVERACKASLPRRTEPSDTERKRMRLALEAALNPGAPK